ALARQAVRSTDLDVPDDVPRNLTMLRLSQIMPVPADPAKTAELTRIAARMESTYGRGRYCRPDGECFDLQQLSDTLALSRDPASLLEAWVGWRSISVPMRQDYQRFVELVNEGARGLGFADAGTMWRAANDMPPDEFAAEVDRLWGQVKPLNAALHCHVRAKLGEHYGVDLVPQNGPIPAHLQGNMWAQAWGN